jgi:uncharacterized protein (TIRG00374 family)
MIGKYTQFFLILAGIFAVLGIFSILTDSFNAIASANHFFLILACVFFIVSILIWVFSWAFLLKKCANLPFKGVVLAGCCSVYGSLTPFQFGADALRALLLKNWFKASYSDSLAASMITKGLKFLLISILAFISMFLLFFSQANVFFKTAFFSGFIVIVLAAALFLLPMNKKIGLKIAGLFKWLGKFWKKFLAGEKFFETYSQYLGATSKKTLLVVFLLVGISLFFEFCSLLFCFSAAGAALPIEIGATLFVIAVVLDRAPFLPRGIGLVESIGFFFVSINLPEIASQKIAAALILYAIARIVVPTILSFLLYIACTKKFSTVKNCKNSLPDNVSREKKSKKPEQAVNKNN